MVGCFRCFGVSVVGSVVACREGLFSFDDGLDRRHGNVKAVAEMDGFAVACSLLQFMIVIHCFGVWSFINEKHACLMCRSTWYACTAHSHRSSLSCGVDVGNHKQHPVPLPNRCEADSVVVLFTLKNPFANPSHGRTHHFGPHRYAMLFAILRSMYRICPNRKLSDHLDSVVKPTPH